MTYSVCSPHALYSHVVQVLGVANQITAHVTHSIFPAVRKLNKPPER